MLSKYKIPLLIMVILFHTGCKKLVEVNAPVTSTNAANAYADDATAAAVLTGIYGTMSASSLTDAGVTSTSFYLGLLADEFTLYRDAGNSIYTQYYQNGLSAVTGTNFWVGLYNNIFITNAAIEGLTNSSLLTSIVKQQLIGEAKFIRAYCYLYLVSLYGDVPLALSTNYATNALLARAPKSQVWEQIITDLKDAQGLLNEGYVESDAKTVYPIGSAERVRPNKWAATALLARAYLFIGDYANAEPQATAVINNTSFYNLQPLNNVFLKNSMEAIWQLQPVVAGFNTQDARVFIIPPTGPAPSYPVYLSNFLLNAFEPGDIRKINWIGDVTVGGSTYYYPYKYKSAVSGDPITEYLMVLRLGEQYLIRAEARAQQGNLAGAASDLNIIRTRAQLANTAASTQPSLLTAIQHEAQVELFSEWGHRWLDLKRTSTVDAVMGTPGGVCAAKGGNWSTNWQLFPITSDEIQKDPNLIQNKGY